MDKMHMLNTIIGGKQFVIQAFDFEDGTLFNVYDGQYGDLLHEFNYDELRRWISSCQ